MNLYKCNFYLMLQLLKLDFLSESCKQGFKKIVLNTMQTREMKNIIRPDMIHLLMEAKKGRDNKIHKQLMGNERKGKVNINKEIIISGKLTHDDTKSNDVAAGFATVEESAVGKKTIDRGKRNGQEKASAYTSLKLTVI